MAMQRNYFTVLFFPEEIKAAKKMEKHQSVCVSQ